MYWTCKCHWAHAQEGGATTLNLATWETLGLWRQETLLCEPEWRARRRPLTLLWSLQCNALVCQTTCPHHQHRHELSRVYKNKDFWLKTSLEEFMIISDNGGKVPSGLYLSSGAAAKGWQGCLYYRSEKEPYEGFFEWVCTRTVCVQNIWISLVHAKEIIFLYSVDPTCTKLNHCLCIGSFLFPFFP